MPILDLESGRFPKRLFRVDRWAVCGSLPPDAAPSSVYNSFTLNRLE